MKTLILLCALFGVMFANAEDYCHVMPTQEEKEFIYSRLEIPFYVPFQEVCEGYKKTYGPIEIEIGPHKAFLGKVTCSAGCGLSLLGLWFTPNSEDSIVSLRKEKPYSSMKGKDLVYRFGGGEAEHYKIRDRDDYEGMMSDIRSRLNDKYSTQSNFFGTASTLSCNCIWTIPF